eukprot:2457925-Rhodomonas_salina.2
MKFCAPTCAGSSASNENAESKSKPSADLSPTLHAIDECYRRHVTDVNSAHSSLDKSIAQADLVGEVEIVGRVGGGLVNLLDIDALGGRVALLEHEAHRLLQRNRVRFEAVVERGSGSSIPLGIGSSLDASIDQPTPWASGDIVDYLACDCCFSLSAFSASAAFFAFCICSGSTVAFLNELGRADASPEAGDRRPSDTPALGAQAAAIGSARRSTAFLSDAMVYFLISRRKG